MIAKILLYLISLYQKHLSRYFAESCIYNPSCSNYAKEAIEKYGAFKGGKKAFYRVLRCRPPFEQGDDPVK